MELYLVRHGETVWNLEHKLQGVRDIPLDDKGREQARALRRENEAAGLTFDRVYASPLQRAVETACLITGRTREQLILDDRLVEMSFGSIEGTHYNFDDDPWDPALPANLHMFTHHPSKFVAPPDGETFEQVIDRAGRFLEDLKREADRAADGRTENGAARRVLIVSHGALLHGLMFHLNRRTDLEQFWDPLLRHCRMLRFEI